MSAWPSDQTGDRDLDTEARVKVAQDQLREKALQVTALESKWTAHSVSLQTCPRDAENRLTIQARNQGTLDNPGRTCPPAARAQ